MLAGQSDKEKDKVLTLEDLQLQLLDIKKNNEELQLQLQGALTDNETKAERIKKLEESNQDLFLRASQGYKEDLKEKTAEPEKWVSQLAGEYAEHLDSKQLKELKEIEEAIFS